MRLKAIYQEIVKKGIEADIRSKKEIECYFKARKEVYDKLDKNKKEHFDLDSLTSPFADTRVLNGSLEDDVKSIVVGVDVNEAELLLINTLKEKGTKIDLAISHHPAGRALANFYEVMDLQISAFSSEGVSLSVSENLVNEKKSEIERRVHAANHQKVVDMAKWLNVNLLCMHTPCDNLAYQYVKKQMDKEKPQTLGAIVEVLEQIAEYNESAKNNNHVTITIGNKNSRASRIHIDFTGGTEGPVNIYDKLAASGIDTIIAMHQSEEHFKKCRECNINVIVAPHIASDNLGINIMLDYLETKEKFKIYEFAGFRRFSHKGK